MVEEISDLPNWKPVGVESCAGNLFMLDTPGKFFVAVCGNMMFDVLDGDFEDYLRTIRREISL